jgi:hypothetical protein
MDNRRAHAGGRQRDFSSNKLNTNLKTLSASGGSFLGRRPVADDKPPSSQPTSKE